MESEEETCMFFFRWFTNLMAFFDKHALLTWDAEHNKTMTLKSEQIPETYKER